MGVSAPAHPFLLAENKAEAIINLARNSLKLII